MASEAFVRLNSRLMELRSDGPPADPAAMRAKMEASAFVVAEDIQVEDVMFAGIAGEWVSAPNARSGQVVFYIHGGGFVMGSPRTHRKLAGDLSRASGISVLVLDYRLAPEMSFPGQIKTLTAAAEVVLEKFGADNVIFAGDSAGGGMVVSCMLELRDRSKDLPVAGVCLSPWADLARNDHSNAANVETDPIVRPQDTEQMARWYLQGADADVALASPARADLSGLPPLLIQAGSAEILVEDAQRLGAKALSDGVQVTLEIWPDMLHVWQMFAGRIPESTEAVERIGQFVTAALSDRGRARQETD